MRKVFIGPKRRSSSPSFWMNGADFPKGERLADAICTVLSDNKVFFKRGEEA